MDLQTLLGRIFERTRHGAVDAEQCEPLQQRFPQLLALLYHLSIFNFELPHLLRRYVTIAIIITIEMILKTIMITEQSRNCEIERTSNIFCKLSGCPSPYDSLLCGIQSVSCWQQVSEQATSEPAGELDKLDINEPVPQHPLLFSDE